MLDNESFWFGVGCALIGCVIIFAVSAISYSVGSDQAKAECSEDERAQTLP